MHVHEAIQNRRAVKHYDPDHKMSEADIEKLLSLALLAPTSFNIQNVRYVVVKDPELRTQIREAAWGQAQVTDASLLIVLCGAVKSWADRPERYWKNAPPEVSNMLVPMIGKFYDGREQLQRDEAMRSTGLAAQTIMLAAQGMGYDSCPMVGFDAEAVAKLIKLPADHVLSMFVVVGKKTQDARPRGGQLGQDEVVIENTF